MSWEYAYEFEKEATLMAAMCCLVEDKASFRVAATHNRLFDILGASKETQENIDRCIQNGECKKVGF